MDTLTPEQIAEAVEYARSRADNYAILRGSRLTARATLILNNENIALRERVALLEKELDEAVNWNDIVERHGLDQFDDLAEAWLAMEPIKRVHNAVASVFSKWANDELIERFKQHMSNSLQMAFVEGCLVGVKAAEAKAAREALQQPGGQ